MKVVALKWWLIYQHTPEADIAVAVSSDNVAHISCVKGGVPTCSDADAPQSREPKPINHRMAAAHRQTYRTQRLR